MLANLDLSLVSHFLSSRDKKSSDKINNSLVLPASLKSYSASAAFNIRPKDCWGAYNWQAAEDGETICWLWGLKLVGISPEFLWRKTRLPANWRAPFWLSLSEETRESMPRESSRLLL